ncbi:caspase family protein [Candidatus Parcubacteria bacterium]|nr:caspase family protein [Candidatus Parcubacteria bacterium]
MKKILYLAIVFCCVLAMPVVAAMKSNSTNNDANQNNKSDLSRPIRAANIKIAKKMPATLAVKETKGKPSLSGKDKNKDEGAATGVLSAPLVEGANKYAVVIGICDYPGGADDICASDGDSYNMVTALIENYGYLSDNIYWFRDMGGTIDGINYKKPTRGNIYNAIMDIKNNRVLSNNDEVIFFFSGHGASGIVNDGDDEIIDEGIVVHDGSDVDFIWDGELRDWFDGFNTERIIFIFDTCLAGGMNDVAYNESGEVYSNRVVVMSSKETQYSYVYSYGEFGEGMFSRYFVNEGTLKGLADKYDHGIDDNNNATLGEDVVVEEAFDYAKKNIPPYLKRRQSPVIEDNFTDDLLL